MTLFYPMCFGCKNYIGKKINYKCRAYPKQIPDEILFWDHDHRNPFLNDQGIQFEQSKTREQIF